VATLRRSWQSNNGLPLSFTPCSKNGRHQTRGGNSANSQPTFKNFYARFSSKFAIKCLLKILPHVTCVATLPYETLMSENERQSKTNAVNNDKLHGRVITYLRCGRIFNNQTQQ